MKTMLNNPRKSTRSCLLGLSLTGAVGLACLTGSSVRAQEQIATPAPQQIAPPKNRAPVAKNLLDVKLPRPKEFTLVTTGVGQGKGAHVLVVEDHALPLITISVSVRAGSLFENTQKPGVADMTADQLTEGTQTRDYEAIARETERLGASLGASAGDERATVSVSGLSEDTDQLIGLLADVLLHPTFPADRLAKAKFQAVAARARQTTNPQFLAGQLTREVLYGADNPYGHPVPTPAEISAITPNDLHAFYSQNYVNAPTTLIGVAGDVKAKDIEKKLETALASWGGGANASATSETALPTGSFAPKNRTTVYLVDRPGSGQTYLTFANLGIRRTDPNYFALQVANYILGGSFNSRLNQDLREQRGYTYGVSSGLTAPKYPGTWIMGGAVRNAVTAPAIAGFFSNFDEMRKEPPTTVEMDAAKRAIIGRFALTLESPSSVLARLLDVEDYGLPADYWDTYPQRVQAVTPADVQRVTQTYLDSGRVQLIAVGERQSIEPGLTPYAPITVLSPEQILSPTKGDSAVPAAPSVTAIP